MKDKNGYTLGEVLAVITILSLVIVLTVSVAVRLLDQTKRKVNEYDEKILLDAAITYGEDLDKNGKSYFLIDDMSLESGSVIHANAEVNGYALKSIINEKKELPVKTSKLRELGYIDKKLDYNCTIDMVFETSIQDGYIVIDKISAKLEDDCK